MNRETFERILIEEGIDDEGIRAKLWYSQPPRLDDNEERLREAARKFSRQLPELLLRQALNRAMDRELGRGNQAPLSL